MKKSKNIWSGYDILQCCDYRLQKKKKLIRSLNLIEKNFWRRDCEGLVIFFIIKYLLIFFVKLIYLRLFSLKIIKFYGFIMFSSILELMNIVLLSMEGSINFELLNQIKFLIRNFFLLEFVLKIHAKSIQSIFFICFIT